MPLDYVNDTVGHVYTPPAYQDSPDAYGLSSPALYSSFQHPSSNARFTILKTEDILDSELGDKCIYWRLEVSDLRQGFQQVGRWENNYGGFASSTLNTSYEENGVLPFLSTGDSSFTPTVGTLSIQHFTNVFSTYVMSVESSTPQSYLYKETSATNPALTAITYAKGSSIRSLNVVKFVGAEYLAVGLSGAGVDVLSNLTTGGPTSAATMDAATINCTGIIQTFLPGAPLLLCANGSLFTMDTTGVITVAPVPALTSFPYGAYALGLASLGGSPVRAFWHAMSLANYQIGSIGAAGGINPKGSIISTAQDGTTPQTLTMPLSNILHAALYRDGVLGTDEDRVIFHNGRTIRDLRVFRDVPPNSDKRYKVAEFYIDGPALYAEINIIASPSGTGNTQRAIWYYDYDNDAWFQVSATQTLSSTGIQSFGGNGGVSQQTGFLHTRAKDAKFWRMFHQSFGVNPFSYRKTSGAQAGTGQEYEASGVITLTANELPGLEGMPKIIRSVQFMGDVDSGGTGGTPASIKVTAPGVDTSAHTSGNFQTGISVGGIQRRDFEDNTTSFFKFQPTITVTRQSSGTDPTRFTPQFLPIAFEGVAYWRPWVAPASREEVNT